MDVTIATWLLYLEKAYMAFLMIVLSHVSSLTVMLTD